MAPQNRDGILTVMIAVRRFMQDQVTDYYMNIASI